MSEVVEETAKNKESDTQIMSIQDAMNYADSGKLPEVENEEEVAENQEDTTKNIAETEAKEELKDTTTNVEETTIVEHTTVVEDKKEVEVETTKEVEAKDPYEGIDEEDRPYFEFKKRNKGTTRADYEDSLIDYDAFDRKELLRRSLREKYNLKESDYSLNEYIENEYGIPMDEDEKDMSLTERVKIKQLTADYLKNKKEQHAKWAENGNEAQLQKEDTTQKEEMVRLEDGREIPKAQYDNIVEQRKSYVKNNEDALNRVKETSFAITVDDNGEKRELKYNYTFDKEDKHRMLSISSDAVKHFNETYQSEDGVDHENLNINKAWEDPKLRGKMLKSFAETIRAEAIEESLQDQGNIKLGTNKGLPQQPTKGIKYVPLSELLNN